jgi:hypothetical protein
MNNSELNSRLINLGINNFPSIEEIISKNNWIRFCDKRKDNSNKNLALKAEIMPNNNIRVTFYNHSNLQENFYLYVNSSFGNYHNIKKRENNKNEIYKFIYQKSYTLDSVSNYLTNEKKLPYKFYKNIGLKFNSYQGKKSLLVPYYHYKTKELKQIELISEKPNEKGKFDKKKMGSWDDCYFSFGNIDPESKIFIGEGLATVLSVYACFPNNHYIVAGGISNISKIAKLLINQNKQITVIGDYDIDNLGNRRTDIDKICDNLNIKFILPCNVK